MNRNVIKTNVETGSIKYRDGQVCWGGGEGGATGPRGVGKIVSFSSGPGVVGGGMGERG